MSEKVISIRKPQRKSDSATKDRIYTVLDADVQQAIKPLACFMHEASGLADHGSEYCDAEA
jgi:hypothetical protein